MSRNRFVLSLIAVAVVVAGTGCPPNSILPDPACAADTESPTFTCPTGGVQATAGPDGTAPVPDLRAQLAASDNCTASGRLAIEQFPAPGTAVGVGATTIRFRITDEAGNEASDICATELTVSEDCESLRLAARRITGTIRDGLAEGRQTFNFENYFVLSTVQNWEYAILLDLTVTPGTGQFTGTARVTWMQHNYNIEREMCSSKVAYDWNDRSWTVNVTGSLSCATVDGVKKLAISGGGTPDGSGVPQQYTITDEGCYSRTQEETNRATWSSFFETGLELDTFAQQSATAGSTFYSKHTDLPLPYPPQEGVVTSGRRYREIELEISR